MCVVLILVYIVSYVYELRHSTHSYCLHRKKEKKNVQCAKKICLHTSHRIQAIPIRYRQWMHAKTADTFDFSFFVIFDFPRHPSHFLYKISKRTRRQVSIRTLLNLFMRTNISFIKYIVSANRNYRLKYMDKNKRLKIGVLSHSSHIL